MDGLVTKESYPARVLTFALFFLLSLSAMIFSIYLLISASSITMLLIAIAFTVLSVISSFFNIFGAVMYYRSYFYYKHINEITKKLKPLTKFPTVAVIMPVFNEDTKVVERNMLRLTELRYPKEKLKFYLLDDSTNQKVCAELERFSKRNSMIYLHRDNRKGFKAGAFNNMLKHCKEQFVAIFDYDEYLTNRNFLKEMLPYFSDQKLAFVQSEKSSFNGNFFSDTVRLFDAFFFRFIEPARVLDNTAIFAGSCGIIRRSVLDEIGGFPEYIVEDTYFSFESDLHNYKGLFIPKIYAYGKPAASFTWLMKQQWRYNYGDTQFISYFRKRKSQRSGNTTLLSTIDYYLHGFGLNYISGILVLFTLTSLLLVFSNLPLTHFTLQQIITVGTTPNLALLGGIAFLLSILTPIILTKMYFNSWKKGIMVFVLNFALSIARMKAAIAAFLKRSPAMHWTRAKELRKNDLIFSILNTKVEIAFGAVLLAFGYLAAMVNNISGSVWLLEYGVLYLTATLFIYKYG